MALQGEIKTYEQACFDPGVIVQKYVELSTGVNELVLAVNCQQVQIMEVYLDTSISGYFAITSGADLIWPIHTEARYGPILLSSHAERPLFGGNQSQNLSITVPDLGSSDVAGIYIQYRMK